MKLIHIDSVCLSWFRRKFGEVAFIYLPGNRKDKLQLMMQKPCIPLSLAKDLSCGQCQNFVSCGPVYVVPPRDIILCGRCQYLAKQSYQNKAYEALASMFLYPCRYWTNYCSRSLKWDESLQHEDQCSYNGYCNRFWLHPKTLCRGKRDLPYGDIRLVAVPEYLLDHIKCALCELYLTCEPVFIQPNGKNICHRCVNSNGVPPSSLRNFSYEQLSSIIIFPCVFRNRGCPTRLKFGKDLWQHESQCSYNQMFKKAAPKATNQKEKGVIQTHSGHVYGTITPYSAAFAPPTPNAEFDSNEQLLKSLKKQQERKFARAEDIGSSISKLNSEDSSSSDYDADRSSVYDKSSLGGPGTPTRVDEPDLRRMRSNTPQYLQRDSGYHSSDVTRVNNENLRQNMYSSQFYEKNDNYNEQYSPGQELKPRSSAYSNDGYSNSEVLRRSISANNRPVPYLDYNLLAGHYPIFNNKSKEHHLLYRPSFNGGLISIPKANLVRTDSLSSNRELIEELKQRQSHLKDKKIEEGNPYKECHNLDEVLQVHDAIGQ